MTIKCDKGGTRIQGSTLETIQDFINIINAVRLALEDELNPEDTKKILALCGQLAYARSDGKINEEVDAFKGITALLVDNSKK